MLFNGAGKRNKQRGPKNKKGAKSFGLTPSIMSVLIALPVDRGIKMLLHGDNIRLAIGKIFFTNKILSDLRHDELHSPGVCCFSRLLEILL